MRTGQRQEPEIVTFGCRLNAFESEVIRDCVSDRGNAIIFNTCAVTAEAERQARQAIRKARRANPDAEIIVTGCAAQVNAAAFAAMPEVDRVLGNAEKLRPESYIANMRVQVGDIMQARETAGHLIEGFDGRARAFVQVQQGCDHRCTFCIIPFGRGNSRSVPIGEIVTQVRQLVENGYREIVLTGVDITSYGTDLPGRPALGQMARRLLQNVPELPRLRISSIDCIEIDADLLRLIENEPRLMPHFHLSLQSGDDMILKRMKRRHGRDEAIAICDRIRAARPDVVLGADLIAGFPTETDDMFRRSYDLIEECGLTWLHVFPYSARPGTPAARMPQVDMIVRRERARLLREAGDAAAARFLDSRIGRDASVLVEQDDVGRTEHYAPILCESGLPNGSMATLRVTGRDGAQLTGRLAA
ncbi:MAG: tRNA (N(6)-L-threonylcarbamoyladenosine(37)-C(2))-methylthiotransferase MtaB [Alphaproteobacteria bacterium]